MRPTIDKLIDSCARLVLTREQYFAFKVERMFSR